MPRRKFLSDADLDRITEATRRAELRTSAEIVTVIATRAGAYTGHVLLAAAVVLFLFSVAYLTFIKPIGAFLKQILWAFDTNHALWTLVIVQAAVFLLTYAALSTWPGLKRLIISKKDQIAKVHSRAGSEFFGHHVAETAGETGVLIYIALFERRVELLVDSGIAAVVPRETWKDVVEDIIRGVKRRTLVDVLCGQIERIGEVLSKNFPRKERDINELPDRPVLE